MSDHAWRAESRDLVEQNQAMDPAHDRTSRIAHAGLPNFLRFDPAEDAPTRVRLERLNQLTRTKGWRAALDEVFADDAILVRYVTQPERKAFLHLLPITPQVDVLEIGPGMGQFTATLGRMAKSVCALEVVPGQAEFVAERCRQEGLSNVQVSIGGDDCRLPYADASFDVVVLSLVFEWCGSRLKDEPHEQAQRRLLDEMSRVLRPGGTLYLTTKNRYALRLLVGKPDEHMFQMRFGSALPRRLAGYLLRRRGHSRPMGMLHSHRTLQKMLRQAGFESSRSFWAAPEMRYPTHYVPNDVESIRRARRDAGFVQGDGRLTRLLMRFVPAPWVKHVTPGLTFVATKAR